MHVNDLPPQNAEQPNRAAWRARLALHYAYAEGRSVLAQREHEGPLAVQKTLYPEGNAICHNFVLHPPAGVAGGDELDIQIRLDTKAHAVLSTPGAGKWYRSSGSEAQQRLHFKLAASAMLEWLPAETILYSGARAWLHTRIDLDASAAYLGWEITCLGRPASSELFAAGSMRQGTEIYRGDRLLWQENGVLQGNDPLIDSKVGMRGYSINATLLAIGANSGAPGADLVRNLVRDLRALTCATGLSGLTVVGDVLILRHLGHSAQAARDYFAAARALLRPHLCGLPAQALRIWQT